MLGKLIALEGIDNVGKSSHLDQLERRLLARGVPCQITKELTTEVGEVIWKYLARGNFSSHMKTLLFAADRVERVEKQVQPALEAGKIVMADRWALSAMVYRFVEGFDTEYVKAVNSLTIKPIKTFLLDIPAEQSIIRRNATNKPEAYTVEFLDKARTHYLQLAATDSSVTVLDGTKPFLELNNILFEEILKIARG